MTCPICKKPVAIGDPEMPFCSERCRLIDLGMWSSEEYRIPTTQAAPARDQSPTAEEDAGE